MRGVAHPNDVAVPLIFGATDGEPGKTSKVLKLKDLGKSLKLLR